MRSLIILLVATTTLLCSFVDGVDVQDNAAFERVAECIYICTHADNADENLPVETVICDAHKVRARSVNLGWRLGGSGGEVWRGLLTPRVGVVMPASQSPCLIYDH